MTRTFDLLQLSGLAEADVTSFQLGIELDAPRQTTATWTARTRLLPAAGSESPPCNDGSRFGLTKESGSTPDLFTVVDVIGDTGGDDISANRDCGCDTHIATLELSQIRIQSTPPTPADLALSLGKAELCPNRLDDVVIGGADFNGDVEVDLGGRLEVSDGRLLLTVNYSVRSVP